MFTLSRLVLLLLTIFRFTLALLVLVAVLVLVVLVLVFLKRRKRGPSKGNKVGLFSPAGGEKNSETSRTFLLREKMKMDPSAATLQTTLLSSATYIPEPLGLFGLFLLHFVLRIPTER